MTISYANKLASIDFAGKNLMRRTSVYTKRERMMKRVVRENANIPGGRLEAYAAVVTILDLRNKKSILIETSQRIQIFVENVTQLLLSKSRKGLSSDLQDTLNKMDYATLRMGIPYIRAELSKFEKKYGSGDDYDEAQIIELSRRNIRAELKKIISESRSNREKN